MIEEKARKFVKQRLGGDIISCHEDLPGKSWQITVKPEKHLITEILTSNCDLRIWSVDFDRREVTVIVSVASWIVYE